VWRNLDADSTADDPPHHGRQRHQDNLGPLPQARSTR
jgi:hypothetical protein